MTNASVERGCVSDCDAAAPLSAADAGRIAGLLDEALPDRQPKSTGTLHNLAAAARPLDGESGPTPLP